MLDISNTIDRLVTPGKGIMACDESLRSMGKRFEAIGVSTEPSVRERYFEMLFGTPDLSESVAGVILYEDLLGDAPAMRAFRRQLAERGILIGVRADRGAAPLPGYPERSLTTGLDDLHERLDKFASAGASFVKWRAAFAVNDLPGADIAIAANAMALTLYAAAAVERGLVPIVEAEIEIDGNHSAVECQAVSQKVLQGLFDQLTAFRVDVSKLVLKTNFVVPGKESGISVEAAQAAATTLEMLEKTVPSTLPLVVFLSGGLTSDTSLSLLNAFGALTKPWRSTFSFGRALWLEPLQIWAGQASRVDAAQARLGQLVRQSAGAAT